MQYANQGRFIRDERWYRDQCFLCSPDIHSSEGRDISPFVEKRTGGLQNYVHS